MRIRMLAVFVILIHYFALFDLTGCASKKILEQIKPPLRETQIQYLPPDGCENLRDRGGSC